MTIVLDALQEDRAADATRGASKDSEAGVRLLESLDDYVRTRAGGAAPADERTRPDVRWMDRLWLSATLAVLLLLGTLLPDGLPSDVRVKGYFEKILTWFPTALLFGKWIKSPDVLLELSRRTTYRVGVSSVLAVLLLVFLVHVRIDANVQPAGSTITVDKIATAVPFDDRLRLLTANVSDSAGDHKHDRTFTVTPFEMLAAGLRLRSDWRLIYKLALNCPDGPCPGSATVDLVLRGGQIDREAQAQLGQAGFDLVDTAPQVGKTDDAAKTVRVKFLASSPRFQYVPLPSGSYRVRTQDPCQKTLKDVTVASDGDPETAYRMVFTCP